MAVYLSAFAKLESLNAHMHTMPGNCDWWKCHNHRHNGTLIINAESYLGVHLRTAGLGCHDVMRTTPPVTLALPRTRRRDWQSPAAHAR